MGKSSVWSVLYSRALLAKTASGQERREKALESKMEGPEGEFTMNNVSIPLLIAKQNSSEKLNWSESGKTVPCDLGRILQAESSPRHAARLVQYPSFFFSFLLSINCARWIPSNTAEVNTHEKTLENVSFFPNPGPRRFSNLFLLKRKKRENLQPPVSKMFTAEIHENEKDFDPLWILCLGPEQWLFIKQTHENVQCVKYGYGKKLWLAIFAFVSILGRLSPSLLQAFR